MSLFTCRCRRSLTCRLDDLLHRLGLTVRPIATAMTDASPEADVTRTPMTDALVAELRRRGVEVLTHDQ